MGGGGVRVGARVDFKVATGLSCGSQRPARTRREASKLIQIEWTNEPTDGRTHGGF